MMKLSDFPKPTKLPSIEPGLYTGSFLLVQGERDWLQLRRLVGSDITEPGLTYQAPKQFLA